MLTKIWLALKKYAWLIAISYTLVITVLSFMSLNGVPSLGIDYEDKLIHFVIYFLFTLVWYNAFLKHVNLNLTLKVVLFAIFFGIIIEILQGSLTQTRQFDYYDITANTLGVLAAIPFFKLIKSHVKKL